MKLRKIFTIFMSMIVLKTIDKLDLHTMHDSDNTGRLLHRRSGLIAAGPTYSLDDMVFVGDFGS
jgi:hypothetical protein